MHLSIVVICMLIGIARTQFTDTCAPIVHHNDPPHSRIVLGTETEKGELKYQVQIRWYGELVCGGSIIKVGDIQAILTAASCVSGPNPFFYSIQAGDWDLENWLGRDEEQVREVDQVYIPDIYNASRPYENDIAVVTLLSPFDLSGNMTQPIALPPQDAELNPNKTLLASGWGGWHPWTDDFACKLQKIEMPLVDRETCQQFYNEHDGIQLSESMFCIGQMDGGEIGDLGAGPCTVDFGGPLVDVDTGTLVGIMTHAVQYRCAHIGYPVTSTRVSYYVNWIESIVTSNNKF